MLCYVRLGYVMIGHDGIWFAITIGTMFLVLCAVSCCMCYHCESKNVKTVTVVLARVGHVNMGHKTHMGAEDKV